MATPAERKAAKRLERRESVQFALEQAGEEEPQAPPRAQVARRDRAWLIGWLGVLLIAGAASFLASRLSLDSATRDLLLRVARGVMLAAGILALQRLISLLLIARLRDPVSRHNLHRVADLLAGLAAAFVAVTVLFRNWYGAAVSLGLLARLNAEPERVLFPKSNMR